MCRVGEGQFPGAGDADEDAGACQIVVRGTRPLQAGTGRAMRPASGGRDHCAFGADPAEHPVPAAQAGADAADASEEFEIENVYYGARNEIRQVVGLLDLSGPDELAACARTVREADRALGKVRFDVEDALLFDRYTLPLGVRNAADAMEAEVRGFVDVARRYVC